MDDWEKFNKTTLPEKEEFYSNLNMEDITDGYQIHIKGVCRDFDIKKIQVNIMICILKKDACILLADIFENFRKISLKI